jgi:hypothetical protein
MLSVYQAIDLRLGLLNGLVMCKLHGDGGICFNDFIYFFLIYAHLQRSGGRFGMHSIACLCGFGVTLESGGPPTLGSSLRISGYDVSIGFINGIKCS